MEERPRDISSWILIAVLIYTAAMWRSLGEWPARDPAGDLRWRHQQRWGDDPISNQDLEQLPLAGTIRQRGSPFCGPTTAAAAQSFWTNIFQRDPQVVTHFMILRGSHHLKQDCNSEEKRKRWMGHKRFGDKSRTAVHYRSSSCTDDAGDDGDLVFSTLTFFSCRLDIPSSISMTSFH